MKDDIKKKKKKITVAAKADFVDTTKKWQGLEENTLLLIV